MFFRFFYDVMSYERSESASDNFSKFIHQFQSETKTLIMKLERILINLYRQNVSLLFHQTCLNKRLLSNHTHTHIYIYIYVCVCIHKKMVRSVLIYIWYCTYTHIYVCMYVHTYVCVCVCVYSQKMVRWLVGWV